MFICSRLYRPSFLQARLEEEKLNQAAMGNDFLLQSRDCAESFEEFNASNIRDTFRVILQMGIVLMFGSSRFLILFTFMFEFKICKSRGSFGGLRNYMRVEIGIRV